MDWINSFIEIKLNVGQCNVYWDNHVYFCQVIEAYLTLCYFIKHGDIGFLQNAIREVCIIMQAPSACKPKYACELLCNFISLIPLQLIQYYKKHTLQMH